MFAAGAMLDGSYAYICRGGAIGLANIERRVARLSHSAIFRLPKFRIFARPSLQMIVIFSYV